MPEIGYNDGSYLTQKGNDLIAKLMAWRDCNSPASASATGAFLRAAARTA